MTDETPRPPVDRSVPSEPPPAPPRPAFSSSLPDVVPLERPKVVAVGAALLAVAVAAHLYVTARAALRFGELRETLLDEVDSEVEEFSRSDIDRAANVLIGAAGILGLVLVLFLCTSYRSLMNRRTGGRSGFIGLTVFYLPVAVVGMVVRLGGRLDEALTALSMLLLLVVVALIVRRPVSDWLHQVVRKQRIPLATTSVTADGDEPEEEQTELDPATDEGREIEQNRPELEAGSSADPTAADDGPRALEARPSRRLRRRRGDAHHDDA